MKRNKAKLIAEAKAQMTEKDYFQSNSFREHLDHMFKFMTRCQKKGCIEVSDYGDATACTDGKKVMINWNSPIQKGFNTFKLKVMSTLGLFYHEVGHIIYTDFDTNRDYEERIVKEGKLDVRPDAALRAEKDSLEYFLEIRPVYRNYIGLIFHNIMNIIEDVWMENKVSAEYPGTVADCLRNNRVKMLDECPTLKRMIDSEYDNIAITMNLILCYASSGLIPNPHQYETVHTQALDDAKAFIDAGISNDNVWGRIIASTNIMLSMWQLIQDEIEEQEEKKKEEESKKNEQQNEQPNSQNKQSEEEKGSSNRQETEKGENEPNNGNSKLDSSSNQSNQTSKEMDKEIEKQLSSQLEQQAKQSSNSNDEARTSKHFRGEKAKKEEEENGSEGKGGTGKTDENAKEEEKEVLSNEASEGRTEIANMLENSPRFAETEGSADGELDQGGKIDYESKVFSTSDGIGSKIEKSINDCAEESVNRELLEENRRELAREVSDVPFTNNHVGVNFSIGRHENVSDNDIEEYNRQKEALKYSKALQKALEETLKKKPDEISRRQWLGKGLDKNNLYDRQQKVFYKKNIPSETNLAVAVLIDESGSMHGRKLVEATRMAVILEDFCRNFKIPVHIAGHHWSSRVHYDIYRDFDDIDGMDRFRLMQIRASGCNRDGAALQYCGEHLLKRPEEKKLLILISDGQPNADGYRGECAKQDLKAIKKKLKQRGVELFAAAIDDDKEYIKAIYGDGFLDMSDLKRLPKTMVRLVENFMNM